MGCSAVEKTVLINGVSASVNELFKKKMSALGSMMFFVGNFRNTSECVTLQQRTWTLREAVKRGLCGYCCSTTVQLRRLCPDHTLV